MNLLAGNQFPGGGQFPVENIFGLGSNQIPSQGGLPFLHGAQYAGFPQSGYVGAGRPMNTSSSGEDVYNQGKGGFWGVSHKDTNKGSPMEPRHTSPAIFASIGNTWCSTALNFTVSTMATCGKYVAERTNSPSKSCC